MRLRVAEHSGVLYMLGGSKGDQRVLQLTEAGCKWQADRAATARADLGTTDGTLAWMSACVSRRLSLSDSLSRPHFFK